METAYVNKEGEKRDFINVFELQPTSYKSSKMLKVTRVSLVLLTPSSNKVSRFDLYITDATDLETENSFTIKDKTRTRPWNNFVGLEGPTKRKNNLNFGWNEWLWLVQLNDLIKILTKSFVSIKAASLYLNNNYMLTCTKQWMELISLTMNKNKQN